MTFGQKVTHRRFGGSARFVGRTPDGRVIVQNRAGKTAIVASRDIVEAKPFLSAKDLVFLRKIGVSLCPTSKN